MQLIKVRYFQLKRDLSYWVVIIAATAFFISAAISSRSDTYSYGLAAAVFLALYSYHTNRKDLNFVTNYFEKPVQEMCLNYNLLSLPVSAGMCYSGVWFPALILHLGVSLIVFLKFKTSGLKLLFLNKYIPAAQFEWISGVRKNFYLIALLFAVCLFFSPVKFFGTVSLFLLNSIFLGFYSSFEPLLLLNPANLNEEEFLKSKVSFLQRIILVLSVPLLLINSILYPDIAWFNCCFIAGFLILASSSVYIKYANYKPNDDLRFHIDFLLLFASAVIPFLLPLAFFLNLSHRKKAIQNLSYYLK